MDTLLIEVTNEKAKGLLYELEQLNLIRVVRQTINTKSPKNGRVSSKLPLKETNTAKNEWWKDKQFVAELDESYKAMECGEDKGTTIEELKKTLEKK